MNGLQFEKKLPFFGIPKILPFAAPYKKRIALMVTLGFISSLIDSVYPLFNRYALDHFIAYQMLDGFGLFALLYVVLLAFQVTDNFISTYFAGKVEVSVNRDLRNRAFEHLQTLSFSYFNRNNVGYIHARVMSDTSKLGELVAWNMMDVVWNGSYVICIFAVMFVVNVRLAFYLLLFLPIAVVLILIFQRRLTRLNGKIRELNSRISANYNEGITGARSVKALVAEERIIRDFDADTGKMFEVSRKAAHTSAFFVSTMMLLSSLVLSVVLWRGGHLTQEGVFRLGTLSVFLSYALGILEPIQNIVSTLARLIEIQVNIKRFFDLLETKPDVADSPEVTQKYGDAFHPKKENWEELHGDVEFVDVSFRYPDGNEYVLYDFNLKIMQGMNVAIVGETGAGKSTLVNLVCRFFEPTKGQVLIDGRPASERSQLWLHSHIGYVLQMPYLFSGSVRENLCYGKPGATDEEIWEALKLVSADEVVRRMEKGLDSEVGEGGDQLSTGEKQLLSFARAILADPRILVLDEATASIDTVTEKAIQDAIRTVIRGRTSFVIAHRLSTITGADLILAVQDGRIVERGTHEELLARRGYYYELYTRQYERVTTEVLS